jgi:hypothetical protein
MQPDEGQGRISQGSPRGQLQCAAGLGKPRAPGNLSAKGRSSSAAPRLWPCLEMPILVQIASTAEQEWLSHRFASRVSGKKEWRERGDLCAFDHPGYPPPGVKLQTGGGTGIGKGIRPTVAETCRRQVRYSGSEGGTKLSGAEADCWALCAEKTPRSSLSPSDTNTAGGRCDLLRKCLVPM